MQSIIAGLNKVVLKKETMESKSGIILPNKDRYIVQTCDSSLKFKNGQEAILWMVIE